jgi:hypothetical protein
MMGLFENQRAKTIFVQINDHKMSRQSISMFRDQRFQARPFLMSFLDINANQDYSTGRLLQTINEFPEILVLRQQGATFNKGVLQNFVIGDACLSFNHINDIVTISPETGDDAGITALIGKKFHFFTIYPKAISSSAR